MPNELSHTGPGLKTPNPDTMIISARDKNVLLDAAGLDCSDSVFVSPGDLFPKSDFDDLRSFLGVLDLPNADRLVRGPREQRATSQIKTQTRNRVRMLLQDTLNLRLLQVPHPDRLIPAPREQIVFVRGNSRAQNRLCVALQNERQVVQLLHV